MKTHKNINWRFENGSIIFIQISHYCEKNKIKLSNFASIYTAIMILIKNVLRLTLVNKIGKATFHLTYGHDPLRFVALEKSNFS